MAATFNLVQVNRWSCHDDVYAILKKTTDVWKNVRVRQLGKMRFHLLEKYLNVLLVRVLEH